MKDPASSVIFIDERIFYFVCDGLSQDIRFDDSRTALMLYAFYAWLEWEKPLKCKRSAKNQFSQYATNVDVHNSKLYHNEKDQTKVSIVSKWNMYLQSNDWIKRLIKQNESSVRLG